LFGDRHLRPPPHPAGGLAAGLCDPRGRVLPAPARAADGRCGHNHRRTRRRPRLPHRHPEKGPVVIRLSNVTKRYSSDVEIGPVSIDLPAGGVIALVGPNGAGKSTVLTMMGRLLAPDEGTIEIGGLD